MLVYRIETEKQHYLAGGMGNGQYQDSSYCRFAPRLIV